MGGFTHRVGVVIVEDGDVVNRMRGGTLRKWAIEKRWPIQDLVAVRRFRDRHGVSVTLFSADSDVGATISHCSSEDSTHSRCNWSR